MLALHEKKAMFNIRYEIAGAVLLCLFSLVYSFSCSTSVLLKNLFSVTMLWPIWQILQNGG